MSEPLSYAVNKGGTADLRPFLQRERRFFYEKKRGGKKACECDPGFITPRYSMLKRVCLQPIHGKEKMFAVF